MTPEQRQDAKERCEAATSGEWRRCCDGDCPCHQVWTIPGDHPVFTADGRQCIGPTHHKWGDSPEAIYGEVRDEQAKANARFIAAARTDLPMALDEIDRLNRLLDAMEKAKSDDDEPRGT